MNKTPNAGRYTLKVVNQALRERHPEDNPETTIRAARAYIDGYEANNPEEPKWDLRPAAVVASIGGLIALLWLGQWEVALWIYGGSLAFCAGTIWWDSRHA